MACYNFGIFSPSQAYIGLFIGSLCRFSKASLLTDYCQFPLPIGGCRVNQRRQNWTKVSFKLAIQFSFCLLRQEYNDETSIIGFVCDNKSFLRRALRHIGCCLLGCMDYSLSGIKGVCANWGNSYFLFLNITGFRGMSSLPSFLLP